ncbi:hypothetical protein EVAR_94407_1 [Eumeta japonica]|uniref:Uncharacterized protein n=1 Tax=Eumeta variegata TaxID=151549 RepID=A0A4C1TQ21_EUMVA|nr:hypothetical protein EVAR_94407_1 [Eumeta japonica]
MAQNMVHSVPAVPGRHLIGHLTPIISRSCSVKRESLSRHGSTDEILASVQSGRYWRNNTKPDIIPINGSVQDVSDAARTKERRRSRRSRPATAHGFPEISITNQTDAKSIRKKYHTLKSLVYTEPVESIKEMRERPRSAGSTLREKGCMTRPSLLETLDFINGVKDALCVEESSASDVEDTVWGIEDEWLMNQAAPLNILARRSAGGTHYLALGDLIVALLHRGKFTILQELCGWLGEAREGALFALHRLARAARTRSTDRTSNGCEIAISVACMACGALWLHYLKLPETQEVAIEAGQRYRTRPPDYFSGDETSQTPVKLRETRSQVKVQPKQRHSDYLPPKRLQELEEHLSQLELIQARLNSQNNISTPYKSTTNMLNESYTGIINPIYDIKKIPKDKFSNKRSKSLGRSTSAKRPGLEVTRYNITLGHKSGTRTNDVVRAINGTTGETGLDTKNGFFQRTNSSSSVVGDSYTIKDAVANLLRHKYGPAPPVRYYTRKEFRSELTASVFVFRPASESSDSLFPSIKYQIPSQEVGNALLTSLRLRVFMGGDDHLLLWLT